MYGPPEQISQYWEEKGTIMTIKFYREKNYYKLKLPTNTKG
jgi:hypothetical protein